MNGNRHRATVNVNDTVRLRLKQEGRAIDRGEHESTAAVVKARGGRWHEYTPPAEDADGWSQWQLWRVMQMFGPHIHLGGTPPFETDIEVSVKLASAGVAFDVALLRQQAQIARTAAKQDNPQIQEEALLACAHLLEQIAQGVDSGEVTTKDA